MPDWISLLLVSLHNFCNFYINWFRSRKPWSTKSSCMQLRGGSVRVSLASLWNWFVIFHVRACVALFERRPVSLPRFLFLSLSIFLSVCLSVSLSAFLPLLLSLSVCLYSLSLLDTLPLYKISLRDSVYCLSLSVLFSPSFLSLSYHLSLTLSALYIFYYLIRTMSIISENHNKTNQQQ